MQPAKKIERQGIALISRVVSEMGHLWNEPQNDFGTDGTIELVDPASEKATNRVVLVQSKATSVAFGERPLGFTCDEDDLRYWLNGNAPVILVRSHPTSGEAYWVSVKDYFRENPEQRASRRIVFDRNASRFDANASGRLAALARPRVDGLHLGSPPLHERLTTNLLPIAAVPSTIYSADSSIKRPGESRDKWRGIEGQWPSGWILWSGRLYSFSDPTTGMLSMLRSGPVTSCPATDWSQSDDEDCRRRFAWLLKSALRGQTRPALRWAKNLAWMAPTESLPVEIAIPETSTTRGVVKEYRRPDGSLKYVRHLAFAPAFVCYDEQWYLEITPTYQFTRDGREPDFYAGSYRAQIKRIERSGDFRRSVDTLARVLRGAVDLGGLTPDPEQQMIEFTELAQVELDSSDEEGAAVLEITGEGEDDRAAA